MEGEIEAWLQNAQLCEMNAGPRVRLFRMSKQIQKELNPCINALKILQTEKDLNCLREVQLTLPPPF